MSKRNPKIAEIIQEMRVHANFIVNNTLDIDNRDWKLVRDLRRWAGELENENGKSDD